MKDSIAPRPRRAVAPEASAAGDVRTIFSVGHSTRTLDELARLLLDARVELLVDVRRFPVSARHPQFRREALERGLAERGIAYLWLGESLGGRRSETIPAERSPNRAWKVAGFRHYADAMSTPEFQAGVRELERAAARKRAAVMCAERLWWRCHRRLLADLLVARGWRVVHLIDAGKRSPHELSEHARVEEGRVTYPGLL